MNSNINNVNPCGCQPIVCPERVCVVHCTHRYNQPVIVPVRTHVVNHFVPCYRYEVVRTTSEENVCCNNNNQQGLR